MRERPADKQQQADEFHRRFWSDDPATASGQRDPSDINAILRLWRHLRTQRRELSGNAFRRLCRDEFLNYLRVREWQDLTSQLRDICKELGLGRTPTAATSDGDGLHISVMSGRLSLSLIHI